MGKDDPIEVQVDNMRKWAAGATADIKELQERLMPDVAQMDAISVELAELYAGQVEVEGLLSEVEKKRGEITALDHYDEMEASK